MNKWLESIKQKQNKKAMPILSFPAMSLMNVSVLDMVKSSDLQVEALKLINQRCHPLALMGFMDLSVEAEAFGATIRFEENEVPNVVGSIVHSEEEADALQIPKVGTKRTGMYIDTIKRVKQEISDCPVFAGCIGPFSLAGRLMDVTEAMIYCYEEPDMVHTVLEKVTAFLIEYINAYKAVGADGVFIAEPLAGILSPMLCDEFSSYYVKKIVEATKTDDFIVIYHNCGNNTLKMVDSILTTKCDVYHFGNAISMTEMVKKIPDDVVVMGNIDPVHLKDYDTKDVIKETLDLLNEIGDLDHFVISSGCDIPPQAKWENIDAFMETCKEFYLR